MHAAFVIQLNNLLTIAYTKKPGDVDKIGVRPIWK